MSNNKRIVQHSTVKVAIEVSFAVGSKDYGTIAVPVGAKVFRHADSGGKFSDWFLANVDGLVDNGLMTFNGKFSHFFLKDFENYGISIPSTNVVEGMKPVEKHVAFHY